MLVMQSLFGQSSGVDDAVALLTLLTECAGAVCLLEMAFVEGLGGALNRLSALPGKRVSAWSG